MISGSEVLIRIEMERQHLPGQVGIRPKLFGRVDREKGRSAGVLGQQ
jgi:hypothetical protein